MRATPCPAGGRLLIRTANVLDPGAAAKPDGRGGAPAGDHVLIEVLDTGEGIPPDLMEKIFEPFFTTKEIGKGTGLGLSTVFGIVKQSGGTIDVQSTLGEGTSFRIYLPRHEPAAVPEPAPALPAPAADPAAHRDGGGGDGRNLPSRRRRRRLRRRLRENPPPTIPGRA